MYDYNSYHCQYLTAEKSRTQHKIKLVILINELPVHFVYPSYWIRLKLNE